MARGKWIRVQREGQAVLRERSGLDILPKPMKHLQSSTSHPRQDRFIETLIHKGVFNAS